MKFRLKRLRAISRALTVQDVRKELQFPGFDPYRVKIYMNIEEGIMYQAVPPGALFPNGRILINEVSKNAAIQLSGVDFYRYSNRKDREERYWTYFRYAERGQISGMLQYRKVHDQGSFDERYSYIDANSFKMTGLKLDDIAVASLQSRSCQPTLEANEITIFHQKQLDKSIPFDTTLEIQQGSYFEYYWHHDLLRITT